MEIRILEIFVSLIFFSNKIGMLIEKKIGWALGALGALLAVIYFFILNLFVYSFAEFGLFITMMYGIIVKDENRKVETYIIICLSVIVLFLTVFTFSGKLTLFEFWSSVGMLVATYILHPKNDIWKKKWGWAILAATHVGAAYIGYAKNQQIFGDLQIASSIVGIFGALKKPKD